MATTLLLDRSAWDMCLTTTGDIAVASEPYSQVQDVASECRLFLGEAWYETDRGVPYSTQILGRQQPVQIIKAELIAAAERVPGVGAARVFLDQSAGRNLRGQVQFETIEGVQVVAL